MPGDRHAEGDDHDEPAGEPHAGLLRPGVLAARGVVPPVLRELGQPAVEVAAAQLVGDEQRLAGGVRGRAGEVVLEDGDRRGEVGGERPGPTGRGERRAQLDRTTRTRRRGRPGGWTGRRRRTATGSPRSWRATRPRPARAGWLRRRRYGATGTVAANAPSATAGTTPPNSRTPTSAADDSDDRRGGGELRGRDLVQARPGPSSAGPAADRDAVGPERAARRSVDLAGASQLGDEEVDADGADRCDGQAGHRCLREQVADVDADAFQSRRRARMGRWPDQRQLAGAVAAEHVGRGELRGVDAAGQVLDRDDLGDRRAVGGPLGVDDDVDRLADQRVEGGDRQVGRRRRTAARRTAAVSAPVGPTRRGSSCTP